MDIQGSARAGFEPVEEAFRVNFAEDSPLPDIGASFAVIQGDSVVVDLWAGHADLAKTRPWRRDTLANVYSSTKGVAAACTTLLHSRGRLDYDKPVAHYWPEFAQAGKGEITVGLLLSHQAGLSGLRAPCSIEDLYDWDLMAERLAAEAPLWAPGSVAGYHAITWGFLIGELVRRIDGRSIGAYLRDELCAPLEADVFIGVPADQDARVAEIVKPRVEPVQSLAAMTDILKLTLGNPVIEAEVPNNRAWRAAEIPAANGNANAMGLAKIFAPLANKGSFRGTEYFSPAALARATAQRFVGIDINLGVEIRWSSGFFGNNPQRWYGPNDAAFGHSGWGGSMAFADPDVGLSMAFAMNQMDANLHGDPRTIRLVDAVYACVGRR
ncbi:MAG TPA: serine hydrolase domain-containing protein [Caulobacteraceae bacterium]